MQGAQPAHLVRLLPHPPSPRPPPQVHEAVDRLLALGPVHKTVESVRPTLDSAYAKYLQVHDTLVARPEYKRAYDTAEGVLAKAQEVREGGRGVGGREGGGA